MHPRSIISQCISAGTLALLLAVFPVATRAEDASADSSNSGEARPAQANEPRKPQAAIEEITITARKREENLQSTPVTVSAFSAEDLKDNDVRRLNDITRTVPNLQFDNAIGSANSARIYLRGVGTGDPISSRDPGVGIYLDGAYLPRQQSSLLTLSDIERIEVLRGPQGTLFGKNTIGGAVSIVSKKPDIGGKLGANTEFRAGNFGRFDSRVGIDIPLVDEMAAARVSFATATRDPVVRNKGTGPELQDDKLLAGRVQLRIEPTDALSLNLSYDQSRENRKPQGGKCVLVNTRASGVALNPATGTPLAPGTLPGTSEQGTDLNGNGRIENSPAALATSAAVGLTLAQQLNPVTPGGNNSPLTGTVNDPRGLNNNFFNSCRQDGLRDNRDVASNVSFYKDNLDTMGSIGNVELQLNDNLTLKSITGFRRNDTKNRGDLDYTELNLLDSTSDAGGGKQVSLSQELQLVGSALDDKFNFVLGGFAFHENNRDRSYGGVATQTNLSFSGNAPSRTAPATFRLDPATRSFVIDNPGGSRILTRVDSTNQSSGLAQFRNQLLTDPTTRAAYQGSVFTSDGPGTPDRQATAAEIQATADAQKALNNALLMVKNANPGLTNPILINEQARTMLAPQQLIDLDRVLALPGAMTQTKLKTQSTSFAVFGQGTYDITEKLSTTLGLRFTTERKFVHNQILTETDGVIGPNARQAGETDFEFARSARFTDFSPLVNLSYQATEDLFLYTTYSKAFKSGGFNGRANSDGTNGSLDLTGEIDDENLTAYEVGFKSKWLDNRLVVNGAAYYNRYKDIQLTIPAAGQGQAAIQILNVGENDIKGAELEIVAVPLPGLQLTATGGFLNARYREFIDPTNSDADKRRLPASPTYTYNFGAGYEFPIGNMGDLRLHAEWAARGKSATDVVNTSQLDRGKSGELAGSITWALSDGRTEIGLFGKNLLNREYFINGVSLDASFGHAYRFYNEPRQYGVELRRSF